MGLRSLSATLRVALVAGATILALVDPASAAKGKLDKALSDGLSSGASGPVQVIITAAPGQRETVRGKLVSRNLTIKVEHPELNAISATVSMADLSALAGDPAVASVSIDARVDAHQTALTGADSLVTLDVLRPAIGTPAGVSGANIGVAIIDSGFMNTPDIENRILEGSIAACFNTRVVEIRPTNVLVSQGGATSEIDADAVFLLTGYRSDTTLLRSAGVELNPETCGPVFDAETFETNVSGLFVAGAVIAGVQSGKIFIENGRFHGQQVIDVIAARLKRRLVTH